MRGSFDVLRVRPAFIAGALGRAAETVTKENHDGPSKIRPRPVVQSGLVADNTAH
jgi:hypothetical protein